jgi:hypothetical protein
VGACKDEHAERPAIIFNEGSYTEHVKWACWIDPNSDVCTTAPSEEWRRAFMAEVRTLFAMSPACVGVPVIVWDGANVDAEIHASIKAGRPEKYWRLELTHRVGLPRQGRAEWWLRGYRGLADFEGAGMPRDIVSNVCAIAGGKGATVTGD